MLRSQVGSLTIDDLKYSYDMRFHTEPMADLVLCRVHSGTIEQRFRDGQVEMSGPGTVTAMAGYHGMPLSGQVLHAHYDALTLDRGLLSQVAAGSPRRCRDGPTPVQLTASTPISQATNKHLVEAIDHVHRDIMTNPHATQNPLIAGVVARYLAASTLATYPNTALLEPTIEDRHDTTPALLRRAQHRARPAAPAAPGADSGSAPPRWRPRYQELHAARRQELSKGLHHPAFG